MTSYSAPTHKLCIAKAPKIKTSGMWLGELKRQSKAYPLQAALLLYGNTSTQGDIWLIANNARITLGEQVSFTLQEIAPVWLTAATEAENLQRYIGLTIQGEIYKHGAMSL